MLKYSITDFFFFWGGVYNKLHVAGCLSNLYIQVDVTLMAFNKRKNQDGDIDYKPLTRLVTFAMLELCWFFFFFQVGTVLCRRRVFPKQFFAVITTRFCVCLQSIVCVYKRRERNGRRKNHVGCCVTASLYSFPPPSSSFVV